MAGGGSCYPRPCQVRFEADARDPDGDTLEYEWWGCASGNGRTAQCQVTDLGEFTATARVRDGRGGQATASGTARGVNDPPKLHVGFPTPLRPGVLNFGGGYITDEEPCNPRNVRVDIAGACSKVELLCDPTNGGYDLELLTSAGPGECKVTVTVRDRFGAVGSATGTYPVAP